MANIELDYITMGGLLYLCIETNRENIWTGFETTEFHVCGIAVMSIRKCIRNRS